MKDSGKSLVIMNYNEILAPAGNFAKAIAAIKGGADALCLGMNLFSARAYADNFKIEELKELITICHLRNIKIYLKPNNFRVELLSYFKQLSKSEFEKKTTTHPLVTKIV